MIPVTNTQSATHKNQKTGEVGNQGLIRGKTLYYNYNGQQRIFQQGSETREEVQAEETKGRNISEVSFHPENHIVNGIIWHTASLFNYRTGYIPTNYLYV